MAIMNKSAVIFLAFLVLATLSIISAQRVNSAELERYHGNLNFLWSDIKNYYVNLPLKESELGFDFDNLYEKYNAQINAKTNETDFYRISNQFLSHLKDPNVSLRFKNRVVRAKIFPFPETIYRPMNTRLIENKVVVINSNPELGMTGEILLEINNIPIDTILNKLSGIYYYSSFDAGVRSKIVKAGIFADYFAFFSEKFPDTLVYKVKNKAGNISYIKQSSKSTLLPPLPAEKPDIYLGFHYNNIMPEYKILPGDIGYILIPSFRANTEAVVNGFKRCLEVLENKKVKGVIVDVRWAEGDNEIYTGLLSFFSNKTETVNYFHFKDSFRFHDIYHGRYEYENKKFRQSDTPSQEGYSPWWKVEVKPEQIDLLKRVPVVVLTNEITSDEASLFAAICQKKGFAKLAGEKFALSGHGLITPIMLPDKSYYVRYSFRETVDDEFNSIENKIITPDILVDQSLDDYYKGIDTQINKAAEYLRKK